MLIDWCWPLALRNGTRVIGPKHFKTPRGCELTEVTDGNGISFSVATIDGRERAGFDGPYDVVNLYAPDPPLPEEPGPKLDPDVDVPPQARGDQPASSMTIRERLAADFMAAGIVNGRFRTPADSLAYADAFLAELKERN